MSIQVNNRISDGQGLEHFSISLLALLVVQHSTKVKTGVFVTVITFVRFVIIAVCNYLSGFPPKIMEHSPKMKV